MNNKDVSEGHTNNELLTRIDERTIQLIKDMNELKENQKLNYVTHTEFNPIKNIVYGMVGTILLSVLVAIIALVVK